MARQDIKNRVRGSVNLGVAALKYEQRLQISHVYTSYHSTARTQNPRSRSSQPFIASQHSSPSNAFKYHIYIPPVVAHQKSKTLVQYPVNIYNNTLKYEPCL